MKISRNKRSNDIKRREEDAQEIASRSRWDRSRRTSCQSSGGRWIYMWHKDVCRCEANAK
jgi:hypothetical protein